MITINSELSNRLQKLDAGHEELLKYLITELLNANSFSEKSIVEDKFKNKVSKYVLEGKENHENN